ncbi:MAG: alpha-L-fucosidase [Phycisphaerales bacterium]
MILALLMQSTPTTTAAPPSADPPAPAPIGPLPSPAQLAWKEMGFTGFIHFGPNTFTDREWGHGDEPAAVFAPTQLDARQWVRAMKAAGMGGVVVTAKHHDGFCAWPTALSQHSVRSSPWKQGQGDVLRELSDACRAEGMRFGVYLSPWDRNNPAYGSGEAYNEYFRSQLREVLTSYGPIFEVWFDGACGEGPDGRRQKYDFASFIRTVRELQPQAVIFSDVGPDIRWVGNEQGHAGETCWSMLRAKGHGIGADNPPPTQSLYEGDIDGEAWIPAECDVSIRPGWFYHAHEDDKVKTPAQLLDLYERSVGHNANFHLNVPPDRRGLIHENDVAALAKLGELIRTTYGYGSDLAAGARAVATPVRGGSERFAGARVLDGDAHTYWAADDGVLAGTVELTLPRAVRFDRVQLGEPVHLGQRIKQFEVDVREGSAWRTVAKGTTVGQRRIVRFDPVEADAVRIRVLDARACPALSEVSLHASPAARTQAK